MNEKYPVPSDILSAMRRVTQVAGAIVLLLGIFWAGRESTHGLAAFWEHWWCPAPLVFVLLGAVVVIVAGRQASPAS